MIKLIAGDFTLDAAAGDSPRRTISGTAVPYNVPAVVSDGTAVIFRPGSLPVEGKAPRLFMYHDASMPVGIVTERVDTEEGMLFSAKISASSQGKDAMIMLEEKVIDQVSVGVAPTKFSYDEEGTMIIESAEWMELSLVPIGAFGDMANITKVAASIHQESEEVVLNEEVTPVEEKPEMSEVTETAVEATIPTAPVFAQAKREFRMPSAGEYLAAYHIGGETFAKVNGAFVEAQKAKRSVLEAAAGDIATTDTPGLLPVPVLGPVFQDINYIRPFVTAIGARAYPDGGTSKTFIRPTITTHTEVAEQTGSAEFGAAAARTMVIAANSVAKKTFAGQVSLSVQDIDFTSPAAMQQIMQDLMGQYMIATDNFAVDTFVTGASTAGVWGGTTAGFISDIYECAANISNGSNLFPTHLLVGVDTWKKIGSLVDGSNRPVFPSVGTPGLSGQNTLGAGDVTNWSTTNPLGLQIIVDSNVAAKTMVVFHAPAAEYYEQIRGLMSVENPGTLSRTFSYYGYTSFFLAKASLAQKVTWA